MKLFTLTREERRLFRWFNRALILVGYAVLAWYDARLSLGLFLVHWGVEGKLAEKGIGRR